MLNSKIENIDKSIQQFEGLVGKNEVENSVSKLKQVIVSLNNLNGHINEIDIENRHGNLR